MTNIVYIVNSLNLGGTENLVVQMSLAFQGKYNISVICLDEPGIWAEKLRNSGINVHCFWRQPGLDFSMAGKIASFCKDNHIDLIHAHQCTPWFYGALSRIIHHKPKLLFEEHGRHYPEIYSGKKNIVNKLLIQNLTHKIIAVSKDVGSRLVKYEGITPSRINVIYNGVHPPVLIDRKRRAELRQQLGIGPNDFVIGSVGRLDPIKNFPMLLTAVSNARKDIHNLKCVLVGDGPEMEDLQQQARSLKIESEVIFAGYRQDAIDLLQCMNFFVLCSFSEGTSMALLEAMSSGIPAIVTDVGGNPELITHHHNGWVIPSDDHKELKNAIIEAYSNSKLSQEMANNAHRCFASSFSFDGMLANYNQLYLELVGSDIVQ